MTGRAAGLSFCPSDDLLPRHVVNRMRMTPSSAGATLTELLAQPDWPCAFAEAEAPHALAAQVLRFARTHPDCTHARLLWALGLEQPESEPADASAADVQRARAAAARKTAQWSADGSQLALPLSAQSDPAVLLLDFAPPPPAQHLPDHWPSLLHLADQLLQRALATEALRASVAGLARSEQLQRALFAIADLAGSDHDMPEMLRGIHAIVGSLMYAENCYIVRLDHERQSFRFLYYVDLEDPQPPDDVPLSEREGTLTWYLLRDGRPLRGPTEQLRQQVSGPLHYLGTDSYDWLGVPMLRDGVVQGAIVLQSYEPGIVYSAEDQALLEFVGSHILTALERKQHQDVLESSVRQRTAELAEANIGLQAEIVERERAERLQAALFEIAQLATADIDEEQFYRSIHRVVGGLINARNFFIALLSEERTMLEFPYYVDDMRTGRTARPLGRGLSEYVLRHGQAMLGNIEDIMELARQGEVALEDAGTPSVCWLGVPLLVGDEVIGVVAVQSYDRTVSYGPADQELLQFVASQIANSLNRRRTAQIQQRAFAQLEQRVQERTQALRREILERERVQHQLEHQVLHDALTDLPNRGYLRERMERVLALQRREPERQFALLYLDVDRFKVINDSLGHLAGDDFLKQIALRMAACVREPDLVARLSGDEFAILLEDLPDVGAAVHVAQRVLQDIGAPLQVAGKELEPSASIGIAIADSRYRHADEVLRDADVALYRAKALGRKRFALFDASLQKHAIDVLAMEGELRVALLRDQFVPYFQPILDLESGRVQGYEALIRWNHPSRGLIGPGEFLRIAEDSGNIEAIDWWMFEHSCALAATRLGPGDWYLTLNVSPLHFRHGDFSERLLGMLARTGLAPSRLVIEVTEGSLLDDPEGVRELLGRLRDQGVAAALDDFGTGYSSLSYLHTFPLRIVKIDRSFVARLGEPGSDNSEAVVASILALAQALGLEALAEGIETQAQHDALLAMGCRLGQGYLLGRPAPVEDWV